MFPFQVFFVNSPEEGCGGNINVTSTTPFKTQLTDKYDPFQDCHWQISSPPGYNIQFTINEIDLRNSTFNISTCEPASACARRALEIACQGDYLEVRRHKNNHYIVKKLD